MINMTPAPAVSGYNRQGTWTVLTPGENVSGYTYGGVLVSGTVTETVVPNEVVVEGVTLPGATRGRFRLMVRDILANAR